MAPNPVADYTVRKKHWGQVAGISLDGLQVVTYEYNLVGNMSAKTMENGIRTSFGYDAGHRLTAVEHRKGFDLLTAFGYTLDKVGNRTAKTQTGLNPLTENYSYDPVDQLVQARYGGARTVAYQYDPVGNRQNVAENGVAEAYTVNADNSYTSVGGESTSSDANGNLAASKGGLYVYDAQNRLVSATLSGTTTTFGYDPRNRVVKRSVNATERYLTYSGWDLIEERDSSGSLRQIYVHGAATDELLLKVDQNGPAYYQTDGLGSTVALTGSNGTLIESYTYDAFGTATVRNASGQVVPDSTVGNRFLFTGREWLRESGLYDYRNRVYSAQLGRFLQTDPILFAAGDVNVYRYCGNNSTNRSDPLGLFSFQKRPLGLLPWLGPASSNPLDNSTNTEISHEHGFFEDGSGDNIGFGPNGRFSEDPAGKGYRNTGNTHYDDNIMR